MHDPLIQADDCRLQKQKNHAVEEMARQNRVRIYHELATARKNGVAQVHARRSLSSCAAQDAIEPKAKPEMAAVAWVSRKPVNPRVVLFGGCRLDTPKVTTGLIFLVFSFFEP